MKRILLLIALIGFHVSSIAQGDSDPVDLCLIAIYEFNGSGIEPVNGYDGTPVSLSYDIDRFGDQNGAGYFSDSSSRMELPTTFDIANRTITVWFKVDELTNLHNLYSCENADLNSGVANIIVWTYEGVDYLRFERGGDSLAFDYAFTPSGWHMATMSISSTGKTSFYLDGDSIGELTGFSAGDTGSITSQIGTDRNYQNAFSGWIDEVRIHNCALTRNQVSVLFEQGYFPFSVEERSTEAARLVQAGSHALYQLNTDVNALNYEVRVFDLTGREVMITEMHGGEKLNLSSQPAGIYVATIERSGQIIATQKLVLSK